jgi:hypothetical protein
MPKHQKYTCLAKIELPLQILLTTPHLILNTIGRTSVLSQINNNMHFQQPEQIQRSNYQSLMFYQRFANATEVLLCESNR